MKEKNPETSSETLEGKPYLAYYYYSIGEINNMSTVLLELASI